MRSSTEFSGYDVAALSNSVHRGGICKVLSVICYYERRKKKNAQYDSKQQGKA